MQVQHRLQTQPGLRSRAAQREVLGLELGDLEQALMKAWHLPELLAHITDDKRGRDPQVQCVTLAVRLARHTADRWDNPAVPDDVRDIAQLLNMSPGPTEALLRDLDQD